MLPLALIVVILGGTGQPARRVRRQLPHRLPLQFRPGDVARPRLCDPVPADAAGAGAAAAGPVRQGRCHERLTPQRAAHRRRPSCCWSRCRSGCGNTYYINIASQILFCAVFALGLNVLVGYAGLTSLGHAGLFAHRRLCRRAAAATPATAISPPIVAALVVDARRDGGVRGAVAARDRHRLPDDHAGARPDRLGHRLSLGQPHQRRQRHQRDDAPGAVRHRASPAPTAFYYATLVVFLLRRRRPWRCSCARRSAPA